MTKLLLIFAAGGAGSVARYVVAGAAHRAAGAAFPVGTFIVNVAGCLLIGFLAAAFAGRWMIREEFRVAILVGFLGGFTTFSTFGYETFSLVTDGQWARAVANAFGSIVVGLAAVWLGYRLAQGVLGA